MIRLIDFMSLVRAAHLKKKNTTHLMAREQKRARANTSHFKYASQIISNFSQGPTF